MEAVRIFVYQWRVLENFSAISLLIELLYFRDSFNVKPTYM